MRHHTAAVHPRHEHTRNTYTSDSSSVHDLYLQLEAAVAQQREASERAATATARAQGLAQALAREKAEAEKALKEARGKAEQAAKLQAQAEEAGTRARTELGKARSRAAKLEVGAVGLSWLQGLQGGRWRMEWQWEWDGRHVQVTGAGNRWDGAGRWAGRAGSAGGARGGLGYLA